MTDTSNESVAAMVDEAWRERDLPSPLLESARALRIPETYLQRLLSWNAPPERFEEEVRWANLVMTGTIRFRQVTIADNEAFCELWANSPEEIGDWDVTAERGPNGLAQFELQERPVLNALFDRGVMVACVSFALRNTIVGGEQVSVRYGQAMRVHNDHRGRGYAHWVRSLPWAIGLSRPTQVQYDFIRSHNMTMERWNRKFMPNIESVPKRADDVPGIPVTVQQYPARPAEGPIGGVRHAFPGELERCVELINRTHQGRDLFRPYTHEFLSARLEAGTFPVGLGVGPASYSIDHLYVLEQGGQVVACAGIWDRGQDIRERWRHRESGATRVVSVSALLDFGFAEGHEDSIAALIEHLIGVAHGFGRDYLVAPLAMLPRVEELLAHHEPTPETRYLQWRADAPLITPPIHLDLVYW